MEDVSSKAVEVLVRARYPLIYVVSFEEDRVFKALKKQDRLKEKKFFRWTVTDGLETDDGTYLSEFKDPIKILEYIKQLECNGIFVLEDYHHFLNEPIIIRKLRDLGHCLKDSKKNVVFISPVLKVPLELEKEMSVIDYKLPGKEEIKEAALKIAKDVGGKTQDSVKDEDFLNKVVEAALGLTYEEAENVFAKSVIENHCFDLKTILSEKEQIIRKSGVLEYYHVSENMAGVGGLDELKSWLHKRGKAFSKKARDFGLPEPRGILLLGIPGCGKSLTAKAISSMWQLPLLKLDVGKVFSSLVGSSEENVRRAIATAESIAPSILWLDEMEKGFSGLSSSGQTDGGTTARVFGTFLTWLQEKKTPVFVVATCNSVQELPPELLRKGRFDEIFFVDLPSKEERKEIFRIHLEKRKRDPKKFDLNDLANRTKEFAGSEIEEIIVAALYDAFDDDKELNQKYLQNVISGMIPLSQTMADKIKITRDWAKIRARAASKAQVAEEKTTRQLET